MTRLNSLAAAAAIALLVGASDAAASTVTDYKVELDAHYRWFHEARPPSEFVQTSSDFRVSATLPRVSFRDGNELVSAQTGTSRVTEVDTGLYGERR
jgi:hypothetical protein